MEQNISRKTCDRCGRSEDILDDASAAYVAGLKRWARVEIHTITDRQVTRKLVFCLGCAETVWKILEEEAPR